jgi:mono/diheme cytochrome c family protein
MDSLFWLQMRGGGMHMSRALLLAFLILGVENGNGSAASSVSTAERTSEVGKGHQLYLMNCAHCHAPDASGDEGPDLHGVEKSDKQIAKMIKNGVKGQMPKFGSKLSDTDVQLLIAFIRSLK